MCNVPHAALVLVISLVLCMGLQAVFMRVGATPWCLTRAYRTEI